MSWQKKLKAFKRNETKRALYKALSNPKNWRLVFIDTEKLINNQNYDT